MRFMDALKAVVHSFISSTKNNNTQRIGWANWVPSQKEERWYSWQITTLLLLTNSVKDTIVKQIVQVMFTRFPNPMTICEHPARFFDFLTSKAKDFFPLDSSFDPTSDAICKSPNYCYQKASYIVAMSKKVVLLWCYKNVFGSAQCWKGLREKYCDISSRESLCLPIPRYWIKSCTENTSTLFPKEYSCLFFEALPGIGLKMRHLCAEAIYNVLVGPAIDCHCIRFGVEMGTIHATMNLEQMSSSLIGIYRNDQLADLNEIPASILQVLSGSLTGTIKFTKLLCDVGKEHDMEKNIEAYLRHYNRPT
jgi:hypothetical protein